ncbi:hypothetical protein CHR29_16770 [Pseudomonas monteilii]|nr:hypothetical protein CHR29_16770 [Pseudomonas monteilii]
MHSAMDASNTAPLAVSHQKSHHQVAAAQAARLIPLQYAAASKAALRRECVEHLRASLCGGEA